MPTQPRVVSDELNVPIAPISLDVPVPDAAFAEIDALSASNFRPDLLTLKPVPASIAVPSANLRHGPGTIYDLAGEVTAGTELTLLAISGDWYRAARSDGSIVWVMGELLAVNQTAASLLSEATDIPAPPPPKIATVVEPNLNLRDGPATAYVGMTKLDANVQLDLLGQYNDWLQVQAPNGQQGWVNGNFLSMLPGVLERIPVLTAIPDPNPARVGTLRDGGVNLRQGPGTAYARVTKLGANIQLDLLGRYADWFKVQTPDGKTGWVSNELVAVSDYVARRVALVRDIPALPKPKPVAVATGRSTPVRGAAPAPAPAPAAAAGSLVDFALQYVGSRYVWGAVGPKSFDCSGFTQYVYKQYGLNLPHSSGGQYNTKYGAIINSPSSLQPGDIVFFVNTYRKGISHVGIYIGGGNVVQAMSPALGLGVANIGSGYWQKHYYSAIRPAL
ncbi:MAG: SH3 domain-containing protein [Roseiflexaceae bacterium]|nr:SH3 domain-containing protein [Roseiflexaceae bacterium]